MPAGWPRMLSQGFCGAEDGRDAGVTGFTQTPTESESCPPQHLCLVPLLLSQALPKTVTPPPPSHDTFGAASELHEGTSGSRGMPGTYVAFHVVHAQRDALVRVVPLVVLAALAPPAQPVLDHLQEPNFSALGAHGQLFHAPG